MNKPTTENIRRMYQELKNCYHDIDRLREIDSERLNVEIPALKKDANAYREGEQRMIQRAEKAETKLEAVTSGLELENADNATPEALYTTCQIVALAAKKYDTMKTKLEAIKEWLDSNTTYYKPNGHNKPALDSVSAQIWYHATDDVKSYPFTKMMEVAIKDNSNE